MFQFLFCPYLHIFSSVRKCVEVSYAEETWRKSSLATSVCSYRSCMNARTKQVYFSVVCISRQIIRILPRLIRWMPSILSALQEVRFSILLCYLVHGTSCGVWFLSWHALVIFHVAERFGPSLYYNMEHGVMHSRIEKAPAVKYGENVEDPVTTSIAYAQHGTSQPLDRPLGFM